MRKDLSLFIISTYSFILCSNFVANASDQHKGDLKLHSDVPQRSASGKSGGSASTKRIGSSGNSQVDSKKVVASNKRSQVDDKKVVATNNTTQVDGKKNVTRRSISPLDSKKVVASVETSQVDNKKVVDTNDTPRVNDERNVVRRSNSPDKSKKVVATRTTSQISRDKAVASRKSTSQVESLEADGVSIDQLKKSPKYFEISFLEAFAKQFEGKNIFQTKQLEVCHSDAQNRKEKLDEHKYKIKRIIKSNSDKMFLVNQPTNLGLKYDMFPEVDCHTIKLLLKNALEGDVGLVIEQEVIAVPVGILGFPTNPFVHTWYNPILAIPRGETYYFLSYLKLEKEVDYVGLIRGFADENGNYFQAVESLRHRGKQPKKILRSTAQDKIEKEEILKELDKFGKKG